MKKIKSGSGLDRLSDLPDNVIDDILGCLPLQDAVRTSALSKKWRQHWLSVPCITFNERDITDHYNSKYRQGIISYVLAQHRAKIQKFALTLDRVEDRYSLKLWTRLLSQKCVEDLTLVVARSRYELSMDNDSNVPSDLFSCRHLRKLKLRLSAFGKLPQSFRGFEFLTSLHLEAITMKRHIFECLITSCKRLEQLTVIDISPLGHLHINVPNLQYFCFHGEFKSIRFDTPHLTVLSLKLTERGSGAPYPRFHIHSLPPSIEKLNVCCQFNKFLIPGNMLAEAANSYSCLKTLQLEKICYNRADQLSCLLSLIGIFPNLEILETSTCPSTDDDDSPESFTKFWEDQMRATSFFNQLRYVTLRSFRGGDAELRFIKFVLAISPQLKEMTLECMSKPQFDEKAVMAQLMRFRRKSLQAEVIYTNIKIWIKCGCISLYGIQSLCLGKQYLYQKQLNILRETEI